MLVLKTGTAKVKITIKMIMMGFDLGFLCFLMSSSAWDENVDLLLSKIGFSSAHILKGALA